MPLLQSAIVDYLKQKIALYNGFHNPKSKARRLNNPGLITLAMMDKYNLNGWYERDDPYVVFSSEEVGFKYLEHILKLQISKDYNLFESILEYFGNGTKAKLCLRRINEEQPSINSHEPLKFQLT